jgi:hypothetical protein
VSEDEQIEGLTKDMTWIKKNKQAKPYLYTYLSNIDIETASKYRFVRDI